MGDADKASDMLDSRLARAEGRILDIHGRWIALFMLPLWLMWPRSVACNELMIGSIQQMSHRTWMAAGGEPADILDMRQDDQGFIHWQDGGARRQPVYANVDPGGHEFKVEAGNADGARSEHTVALALLVKRTLYQTRAFQIMSIVAAVLSVITLIVLQYRRMLRTLRDRLEVRHAERERIARELHDTLLQGIQGLILHFQAVAESLPSGDQLRTQIERALDRADNMLIEGRDRVRDLRASDRAMKDLAVAFALLGEGFAEDWAAQFQVVCGGDQRDIDPVIREEIYLIGREALLNAFKHAKAIKVELEIAYDVKQLRICVRDDGIGIDPQIVGAGYRPGHWGLVGMRERTNCIGGKLMIWARSGTGTEIELSVPSNIAYADARWPSRAWFKRLLSFGR